MVESSIGQICILNPKRIEGLEDAVPVSFVGMAEISEESPELTTMKTRKYSEVKKGYTSFGDGDVLFAKITPCMENGKAAVAKKPTNGAGFGTTELIVLRPLGDIPSNYIYHYIHQPSFRREAKEAFTGSAGQQRVPARFVSD
jgi:type I restriction enzyme S subunit